MEKTLTATPHQRATRKWPSSWKKTTMVRTNRNGRMYPAALPPSPVNQSNKFMLRILRPQAFARLADQFNSHAAPFGIEGNRLLDVLQWRRLKESTGASQRLLNNFGNLKEADTASQECLHRYLVGRAHDVGRARAAFKGRAGDGQRREPEEVRGDKSKRGERRKIEPRRRRCNPLGPVQAMSDRPAHVGRADGGQRR